MRILLRYELEGEMLCFRTSQLVWAVLAWDSPFTLRCVKSASWFDDVRVLGIASGTLADTCFLQLPQYRQLTLYSTFPHVIFMCLTTLSCRSVTPESLSLPQPGQTLQSAVSTLSMSAGLLVMLGFCPFGLPLLPDEAFSLTVTVRMPSALTLRSLLSWTCLLLSCHSSDTRSSSTRIVSAF